LREWILTWEPDLNESIKWNMLCFSGRKLVCGMSACQKHLGLAFFRGTDDETAELIIALNDLYVRNKNRDFRAVAMIAAGPDASAWLEELSESADLEIPLTVFRKGPADLAGKLYELNPEVGNTFLVTLDRFVVANVAGIEPAEFGRVAEATEQMLADLASEARSE